MYDGTRGTRDTSETFNFDFPSDGYTMRVNLATPDNVVDYQFGYEDRSVVKAREWAVKYFNGTKWYTDGQNQLVDNQIYNNSVNNISSVKFVNCVFDKPVMCYVPIKNIEFVNCIINCSSPIIFKIRNDNSSEGEYNKVVEMNVKYNNCEITVSDFADTNMRTFMFYTYTWNDQAEDYDYALPIANTVDCTVHFNYGNVKITDAAYATLDNEHTLSELPQGSSVKYLLGITEHGLEYLRKQWGTNATYIVKNENQETPFWIQIGQIVGTGGTITRNTVTKYPANIRYNINSDDFSQSTVLTTLAASTLNTGDKVYFWGDLNTVAASYYASYSCPIVFNFNISNEQGQPYGSVLINGFKTVAIGGNVMSLYFMDEFDTHDTVDSERN